MNTALAEQPERQLSGFTSAYLTTTLFTQVATSREEIMRRLITGILGGCVLLLASSIAIAADTGAEKARKGLFFCPRSRGRGRRKIRGEVAWPCCQF